MTLKDKFENTIFNYIDSEWDRRDVSSDLEFDAEEFAIGFAEWCRDSAVRETPYSTEFTNDWELRSEQKIVTTKELLEIYKKEKGL